MGGAMATEINLTSSATASQDFTNSGGTFTAVFSTNVQTVGAGTGLIDPFERVDATPTEQGYNTDFSATQVLNNDGKGGSNFVHSLLLGDVPIQIINGVAYYRFELDINQDNSNPFLSLDALQIWTAPSPSLSNYDPGATPQAGTGAFPAGDSATLVYNLDTGSGGDKFIGLNGNLTPGSGNTIDMSFLVPVSAFGSINPNRFVYLYSAFGFQGSSWQANDGFEEWVTRPGTVISGHKFDDLNADHTREANEPFLAGWTVFMDLNGNNHLDAGEPTQITDSNGAYTFFVQPGTYTIGEVTQAGWVQSAPIPIPPGEFVVTITAGQTSGNNDFGNFQQATKSGEKFDDLNANGVMDAGEPGLAGFTILAFADSNGNGLLDQGEYTAGAAATSVTDGSGNYSLNLNPGKYIVVEETKAGWFESSPSVDIVTATNTNLAQGGFAITLTAGQSEGGNNFGNFQQATKSGEKFDDLNANGVKDAGEPGLSGWTILAFADSNGNGVVDPGETVAASTTTNGSGNYSLTLKPGQYVVEEVSQAGWTQSFPNGGTYAVSLSSGATDTNNDFGNFQQATKSGEKFNDLNANGVKDAGEPGLSGWTILAFADSNGNGVVDPGETVAASTTTNGSGNYSLTLKPGQYVVEEVSQAGWTQSFPNGGTYAVSLSSGATDTNNDFGNFQQAAKSGEKFDDLNANGVKDPGEPGLSGWTILAFADTNGNGNYSLTLKPGQYVVEEVSQAGWTQSFPNGGTYAVSLSSGATDTNNDFGNFQQAVKSGEKFDDLNANGVKDPGEPGLSGWTILAFADSNGNGVVDPGETVAASTTTNGSGNYSLTLKPGQYVVEEVSQAGWTQSFPNGGTYAVSLSSGATDTNNDFGNFQQAAKSGEKFDDLNANGVKDPGEPGLSGWTILAFADTNGNGNYSLTLKPGQYVVEEVSQAGWTQSFPNGGTYAVSLSSGATDTNNDFGNFQQAVKSGEKFDDLNANGVKDPGEPGLSGWTILAFADSNGNGVVDPGETVAASTTTNGSGNYSLTLKPGQYVVEEVSQAGWTQSFPNGGTYAVSLSSGATDTNNDFGNFQQAAKSGEKFDDLNANGVKDPGEPGLSGWTILAFADTNGNGNYSLTLKPGQYVVEEVSQAGWTQSFPNGGTYAVSLSSGATDTNNDFGNFQQAVKSGEKFDDLNANGVKDPGEPGLSGWTILAFADSNGNGVVDPGETVAASTTTNGSGNYSLTLKPGQYVVEEVSQAGWTQSFPNGGTYAVSLSSGATDTNNDFGNFQQAAKSGEKFDDLNANGVKDPGEPGLSGWTILAFADTNGNGNYSLTLKPGQYVVEEVSQAGWTQSFPNGGTYAVSLSSGATDTNNDFGNFQQAVKSGEKFDDLNANGVKDPGEPGLSGWTILAFADSNGNGVVDPGETVAASTTTNGSGNYSLTLKPGQYVVEEVSQAGWTQSFPNGGTYAVSLSSGATDTNNDFGNFQQAAKSGEKFDDLNANGVKDPGEPGLSGWTILAFADTNGNGNYSLTLKPGQYVVEEVSQAGWTQSFPNGGTYAVSLSSGATDTNNDFGNFQQAVKSGEKFDDLNANGVKDPGEPGLSGWTILAFADSNGNGVVDPGETVAASTTTNGSGNYSLTLKPGQYVVEEVSQAGWTQSFPNGGTYAVSLSSGATDTNNDFGNFQQATKSGEKFDDLNANGVKDAGEPGLSGWTIQAFADSNGNGVVDPGETVAASTTTNGSGNYSLTLKPGQYVVEEVSQAGWTQSFPNGGTYAVSLSSGATDTNNDFGNFQQAAKSGEKFDDLNANGVKDPGEPGLSGWTILAFADTNGNGNYSLTLKPGQYVVEEVSQAGWTQSFPNGGTYAVSLSSGATDTNNDFGNFQQAVKSGEKFDDLNANGVKDPGEPGLSGWTILAFADSNGNGVV